ncbi:MAG TPA: DUF167 domain-containing protein [Terriglobales bacterium]|nr:DUF167 domain-containing protein [Terriglobales bacterium]
MLNFRDSADGCRLQLRVRPQAKRPGIMGESEGALKVAVTAPPVEGKANAACIDLLAKLLKLPKSSFSIAAGQTSRNKVVRISGITADELCARLRAAGVSL